MTFAAPMPPRRAGGKASSRVYPCLADSAATARSARGKRGWAMAYLAMAMFVALMAFGRDYFGWSGSQVEVVLFATFVFGIICGYKVRG